MDSNFSWTETENAFLRNINAVYIDNENVVKFIVMWRLYVQ